MFSWWSQLKEKTKLAFSELNNYLFHTGALMLIMLMSKSSYNHSCCDFTVNILAKRTLNPKTMCLKWYISCNGSSDNILLSSCSLYFTVVLLLKTKMSQSTFSPDPYITELMNSYNPKSVLCTLNMLFFSNTVELQWLDIFGTMQIYSRHG